MTLQEEVKDTLKKAMTEEINLLKDDKLSEKIEEARDIKMAMRALSSRYPELNKKKNQITNEDVIKLCKKILKDEKVRLLYQNKYIGESDVKGLSQKELNTFVNEKMIELDSQLSSDFIVAINKFIPKMMTETQIKKYISGNINITMYKNKMQAMGEIMKNLKGSADGNLVKKT